ncbi:CNNM domain-containing protein [Leptolyngbya sp. NK1-12]
MLLQALHHLHTIEVELAETLLRLTLLMALVLVIGFFVAAELSLVAASKTEISQLAEQTEQPQAKAAQLVQQAQTNLQQYLSVTQTGITAASLLLGWLGEGATVHWIEPWIAWLPLGQLPAQVTAHSIAVVVAFLFVTYIEILLGELIPKVLAANAPEQTALLLIRPLRFCSYLFYPLLLVLNSNVRLLTGWLIKSQSLVELTSFTPLTIPSPAQPILVPGDMELTAANQALELNLPAHSPSQTVAEFMIDKLGHVPVPGERIVHGELELEATGIEENSLKTVLLRRRPLAAHH